MYNITEQRKNMHGAYHRTEAVDQALLSLI